MDETEIKKVCDVIRQTGFDIHCYHGPGHVEKIYENALFHRLTKAGFQVAQQHPLQVLDEDGTLLGDFRADLLVGQELIIEVKAAKAIVNEHVAQILGYLRSARLQHGLLVNFGSQKYQIQKFISSIHEPRQFKPEIEISF